MKASKCFAALALTSSALVSALAHAGSNWVVVERNDSRITSYDRASIGHYDNNDPQHYFPKGEAIRGVFIRLQYLDSTQKPSEPKVDRREELTLFNCNSETHAPVWVELSYRGVPVGKRHFAPAPQLRMGFKPVIDQWNPVGSADDKIYHAVCSANINGHLDILVQ